MKKLIFFLTLTFSLNIMNASAYDSPSSSNGKSSTTSEVQENQNSFLLYKKLSDMDSKLEMLESISKENSAVLSHMVELNWTLLGITSINITGIIAAILYVGFHK